MISGAWQSEPTPSRPPCQKSGGRELPRSGGRELPRALPRGPTDPVAGLRQSAPPVGAAAAPRSAAVPRQHTQPAATDETGCNEEAYFTPASVKRDLLLLCAIQNPMAIQRAHLLHLPTSLRPPLCRSNMTT
jgi:hypothetical protein